MTRMPKQSSADRRSRRITRALLSAAACLAIGAGVVYAKGGTAKPPGGGGGAAAGSACTTTVPNCSVVVQPPPGPVLPPLAPGATGFSITGLIQNIALTPGSTCADNPNAGGTVTVNGIVVNIPTDTIVQYPANTVTWRDAICGISPVVGPVALDGTGPAGAAALYPGVEIRIDGNIIAAPTATDAGGGATVAGIGSTYVGALVYISQQSVNSGSGYISFIDYNDGSIYISAGPGGLETRLLINDPNGRFGRATSSTDARFSVDDQNPTIKAAATGYPMCVPRVAPNPAVGAEPNPVETDPLCPQRNRPRPASAFGCRNFLSAGLIMPRGDLAPIAGATFCSAFVMKAVAGMPGTAGFTGLLAANLRGPTDPDPRQQAPFQVGDFISWAGTLVRNGNASAPAAGRATTNGDVVWVHTIDANVGIFTQPKTLPAYIAVGEFVIGVEPQPVGAAIVPGVESTPRISLEASTTDVGSIVDVYLDDKGFGLNANNKSLALIPTANSEYFRWVTMEAMTGTLTDLNAGRNTYTTSPQPFGGGIATQFVGPQPGRARIRAIKVPNIDGTTGACPAQAGATTCAVTQSPTRYIRVTLRSMCAPEASGTVGVLGTVPATGNLDNGPWFSINGSRPSLNGGAAGPCLQSANFANGLNTGQYMAPVGEFIYPENTLAGSRIVPNNLWQLGFLRYGESGDGSTAPQNPRPW